MTIASTTAILIATGSPQLGSSLTEALRRAGLIARSGPQATTVYDMCRLLGLGNVQILLLDLAEEHHFDLRALDAALNLRPETAIIALLDTADGEFAQEVLDRGAVDILDKGTLTTPTLARAVRYARDHHAVRHTLVTGDRRLEQLRQSSLRMTAELTTERLYTILTEVGQQLLDGARAALFLPDVSETLILVSQSGQSITTSDKWAAQLAYDVYQSGIPRFKNSAAKGDDPLKASAGAPLMQGSRLIGVLVVCRALPFAAADLKLLTLLTTQAAIALQNAHLHSELQHQNDRLERRVEARTADLLHVNRRLEELDQLKSRFITDMTHELRTPITNISLYCDLWDIGDPERRPDYMAAIREQRDRLLELVESILRFKESTEQRDDDTWEVIAPSAFLGAMLANIKALRGDSQVPLINQLPVDIPPIYGDVAQLSAVFEAILANALTFTETGQIIVTSSFANDNRLICLEVIDTGIGIDGEDMPYIFDRFFRGRNVTQLSAPGAGLGLTTVQEIVMRHGGRSAVTSEPGTGTTVRICLPSYDPDRSTLIEESPITD